MSTDHPNTCAIGLTPMQLSQWRDRVLDPTMARTIEQHVGTCEACQEWLQSFATTAQLLRQRYVPPTGASLWRDVQHHIARVESRRQQRPAQIWRGLGAAVAALLIGALFAYAFHSYSGTTARPAIASPTAQTPLALQWRQATTPPGIDDFSLNYPAITFTPTDSKAAYACFPESKNGAVPAIWATLDRAATNWQQRTSPPATGALDGCALVADNNDANGIIATIGAPGIKAMPPTSFYSRDAGQQWQPLSGWTAGDIQESATLATAAYLLGGNRLGVSHDNWHTWTLIDRQITAAGEYIVQFWTDSATGAILALGQNSVAQPLTARGHLWTTNNGGIDWDQLALTPTFDYHAVFAQPPGTLRHAWQICGQHINNNTSGTGRPNDIECSFDGGQTWQARPPLTRTSDGNLITDQALLGFTHDGALIESTDISGVFTLYRLAAGATTWQSVGPVPGISDSITLVDDGSHVVLWAYTNSPITFYIAPYL